MITPVLGAKSWQLYLDSIEASKKVGGPAINVIISELEAWRIDIMQGQAGGALPEVETRLAQIEAWWQQHCCGRSVPEAPNSEELARALIGALDITMAAHVATQDWEPALRRLDASLEVKRGLARPAEDIASTRMDRANMLLRLGRFGEAQAELEVCLQVFQNDPTKSATTLSSLAILFNEQGDVPQAIIQERRSLALRELLPDPQKRAASHNNLAVYLEHSGTPLALAESPSHQLAALIYRLVVGLEQDLQDSLRNYTFLFRRTQATGTPLTVPRVAKLLADSAFRPLEDWLRQRQAGVAEVQDAVDHFLETARQTSLGQT